MGLLEEADAERMTATGRLNLAMAMFCIEEAVDCSRPDDMTKLLNTGRGFLNSAVTCDGSAKNAEVAKALKMLKAKGAKRGERAGLRARH